LYEDITAPLPSAASEPELITHSPATDINSWQRVPFPFDSRLVSRENKKPLNSKEFNGLSFTSGGERDSPPDRLRAAKCQLPDALKVGY
jgi:hypothetical protein